MCFCNLLSGASCHIRPQQSAAEGLCEGALDSNAGRCGKMWVLLAGFSSVLREVVNTVWC